jgi:hypothetical protein
VKCAPDELDGYFECPEDAPPRWLLMLRAYLDESGHESKDWMALAGYIGHKDQWRQFVDKWKIGLGRQRKFLHMGDLRWNKDRTRQLLERLGPIPESCGLEGVMGGVRYEDYEDLVVGTEDEKMMKGYIACLVPMVINVLRGTPQDERIELVFEEQREYMPFTDLALRMFWIPTPDTPWKFNKDGKPRLATWAWVKKHSTILTDPADYLAFALRENWANPDSKKAKWCNPILGSGSREALGVRMSRDQVRRTIKNAQMMTLYQAIHALVKKYSPVK